MHRQKPDCREPSRFRRIVVMLAALMIVAAGCSSESEVQSVDDFVNTNAAVTTDSGATDGTPIDFRYDTFDGGQRALSELPDKPVVLNFFASWCPSCIAEMPDFEAVNQSFGGDVQFLGLAFQDRQQSAEALVAETGITYEAGLDNTGEVFRLVEGLGMPTTVLIDADGVVRRVHSGALSQEALTDLINEHLLS